MSHLINEEITTTIETNTNSFIARDLGFDSTILTLDDSAQPLDKSGKCSYVCTYVRSIMRTQW